MKRRLQNKSFPNKTIKTILGICFILTQITITAQPVLQKVALKGVTQGSGYTVTYFDEQGRNFQHQVDSLLNKIEMVLSFWKPNSQINQVNQNKNVVLDPMFIDLVNKARYISEKTDGAFDITVGGLVRAWGFITDKPSEMSQHKVDSMLKYVGYDKIHIKNNRLVKKYPQIAVDFNAIAQGYTSAKVAEMLSSYGITSYLVDVGGGEIVAKGLKLNNAPWVVAIEKPASNKDDERTMLNAIVLLDRAIATSGDYRKYYEKNGQRYSHHIDPKTGYPVNHSLLSVSVLAKEGWEADALGTAFMIMGMEKAIEFLKKYPEYDAQFIYFEDGVMKTYMTERMREFMIPTNPQ